MGDSDAMARFAAAKEIAARRGFEYVTIGDVVSLPASDLVDRLLAIGGSINAPKLDEAHAYLGGEKPISMTVSQALSAYWPLTKDEVKDKSPRQLRAWENPRKKAVRAFINTVGDLELPDLTREHFLNFRETLGERVQDGQIKGASANKDLIHLRTVLNKVNDLKDLGLDLRMEKLKLKEDEQEKRPPFSTAWIQEQILVPGALDGLNDEATDVVRVMANLGARPSEIVNLTADRIHIQAEVPYVEILPVGRGVKSANAKRKLPLIGSAFEAMQRHRDGFPRYVDNANALSALLGKYFRNHGLYETDKHAIYSLRHSFSDRLIAEGVDQRLRDQLMGHAPKGVVYGDGASLEHLQRVLTPISF